MTESNTHRLGEGTGLVPVTLAFTWSTGGLYRTTVIRFAAGGAIGLVADELAVR